MVIYGDVLFLLNLLLDYGVLLVSARISACPFVRLRLLAGASFGAVYAVAVFVPPLQFLAALPLRLCAGAVMTLIAFGGQRGFVHLLLVLFGVTMALGGAVLALTAVGNAAFPKGVPATVADLLAVLLAGAAGCSLLTLGFRRRAAHRQHEFVKVRMGLRGQEISFQALVDTGNALTDRNQRQVVVVDWQVLAGLLPEKVKLTKEDVSSPGGGFEKLAGELGPGRVSLLCYRTVGQPGGLLLGVRPDWVRIANRDRPGLLAAFSPYPVSDGGTYQGLVGAEEMGGLR